MEISMRLTESLICFANIDSNYSNYADLGIVCQANMEL